MMRIQDLSYVSPDCKTTPSTPFAELKPVPFQPRAIGEITGCGVATYADARAIALGEGATTYTFSDSYAQKSKWGAISFSHGFASANGSEGAATAVDVGGTGDYVYTQVYSYPGSKTSSQTYGIAFAIDSPYV